jgi:hypothetical protein
MRFFFIGPRILGIRPGIILGASDFRKAFGAPRRGTVPGRSVLWSIASILLRGAVGGIIGAALASACILLWP